MGTVGVRVISGDGAILAVGAVWGIVVDVRDVATCVRADDQPTVTITLPAGGGTAAATVAPSSVGLYVAEYVTTVAGRHVAEVDTGTHGTAAAACTVRAVAAALPDVDELRDYMGEVSATDDEISDALAAESDAQTSACRVPAAYPNDLRQALKRRVARNLAMRGIPLAVLQGDADGGDATVLPGNDPEVRRFERPWRRLKMG